MAEATGVGSDTKEAALIGVLLLAIVAVSYLLSLSLFQVALLVTLLAVVAVVTFVPGAWPTLYRSTGISPLAWLAALAVVATGLGLSYVVGDPQPFCDRSVVRGCITAYGYASAVWIASGLALAVGLGHLGRYRLLRGTATEPAAEASEGPVAVEGRIAPAGGTRPGPVSGEPTVWYHAVTERPTVFDGHLRTDAETAGDRFYVEDGSGRLLVVPDRIDRHDAASLARAETANEDGRRRREWSYRPDDAVTVVGTAREVSRAEYPEPVVVGLDGPVIVGQGTRGDLLGWAAQRALVGTGLAVVVGSLALGAMLLTA